MRPKRTTNIKKNCLLQNAAIQKTMELHVYLAFVAAVTIMIALPGPSVLLTGAHSISFGWQRAIATVAGATVGISVQLIVAAAGLASLLNAVAEAFEWLRWAGAAYLVYFLVITFCVTSVWALVAGNARGFLQSQRAFQSVLQTAGGSMIIAGMGPAPARRDD